MRYISFISIWLRVQMGMQTIIEVIFVLSLFAPYCILYYFVRNIPA